MSREISDASSRQISAGNGRCITCGEASGAGRAYFLFFCASFNRIKTTCEVDRAGMDRPKRPTFENHTPPIPRPTVYGNGVHHTMQELQHKRSLEIVQAGGAISTWSHHLKQTGVQVCPSTAGSTQKNFCVSKQ